MLANTLMNRIDRVRDAAVADRNQVDAEFCDALKAFVDRLAKNPMFGFDQNWKIARDACAHRLAEMRAASHNPYVPSDMNVSEETVEKLGEAITRTFKHAA